MSSPSVTDEDTQQGQRKSPASERNKLLRIRDSWKTRYSDFKLSTPTNRVPEFEAWMELRRKIAVTYRNLIPVKAAKGFRSHATGQNERGTPFSEKTKRKNRKHNKLTKGRLVSPSGGIQALDRDFPESNYDRDDNDRDDSNDDDSDDGDDSERIFPYSPDTGNNAYRKLASTPLPYGTNTRSKRLHGRTTSANDIQSAFTIASSPSASCNLTRENYESRWFYYEREVGLSPIPEEYEGEG
jgi:hypothetical protein